jgi:hypothetical protein
MDLDLNSPLQTEGLSKALLQQQLLLQLSLS